MLLFIQLCVYGQQISRQEAINAAVNTLNYQIGRQQLSETNVDTVFAKTSNGYTLLYEVHFRTGATVLLSGNKACLPILGYILPEKGDNTTDGILNHYNELPDGLRFFVDLYKAQVEYCFQNEVPDTYKQDWNDLQQYDASKSGNTRSVSPLISTKWGQSTANCGSPNAYNYYAPGCGSITHCAAGCVAVAMGQILKKWNYPQENYYKCHQYDWSNMPNELRYPNNNDYIQQRHEIAQLLRDCGLSVKMSYCNDSCTKSSSGASSYFIPSALDSFDYKSSSLRYKSNYNDIDWIDSLKADLDNGFPIYYTGRTPDNKQGHAFVCDGYDNNNLFHFNWGWNGSCDGYFALTYLNPSSTYNFTNVQCAIFHIQPRNCWKEIVMQCNKSFANGTSQTYYANQVISNNGYVFNVNVGAQVHMYGGDIQLTDGFYAAEGSDFEAVIAPCSGRAAQNMGSGSPLLLSGYSDMPSQRESSETGITEPNVKQSLKLWPNPVSGMLHIQLLDAEKEVARITVCDLLGRVVLQKENLPKPEIEVSSLPNGMYLLQLQLSDGTNLTAKFVKD